nr:chlorophyll a-b binding protein 6A [Hymenophyllum caudiculatum]
MAASSVACSHLAAPAVSLPSSSLLNSKFLGSSSSFTPLASACSNGSRLSMSSCEWFPGQPRPAHLDGSSPGDFGFDPLNLAEIPENFERYKESELIHCRWAMVAVPGVLIPEALGLGNWVEAQKWAATPGGQATYLGNPVPWGYLPIILAVEAVVIAVSEARRNMEPDLEKRKYPGGAFDPLGFSRNPQTFADYKVRELKNGRLALVAFVGFCIQAAAYPGTGPVENLLSHLSDPWHKNIAEIIIPRGI